MLKFVIACAAIISWPLAIAVTWQYFNQSSATDYSSRPHWSLFDLAILWAIALGSGAHVKKDM